MSTDWPDAALRSFCAGATKVVFRDANAQTVPGPESIVRTEVARDWSQEMETIHDQDRAELVRGWYRALRSPNEVQSMAVRSLVAGQWRNTELKYLNLLPQRGLVIVAMFDRGPADPSARPVSTDDLQVEAPAGAIQFLDPLGQILRTEGMVRELFGVDPEPLVGSMVLERIHPDDHEAALAMWLEVLEAPSSSRRIRQRLVHPDGSVVWIESAIVNQLHVAGIEAIVSVSHDVGRRIAAEGTLRSRARDFAVLAEEVPTPMFRADPTGQVTFANRWFWDLFGLDRMFLSDLGPAVDAAWSAILDGDAGSNDVQLQAADGRWLHLRCRPVCDDTGALSGVVGTIEDITDEMSRQRELEHRSERDALTGLSNRWVAEHELDRLTSSDLAFGVVFVDLDGLKRLNDDFGHDAGDEVLRAVAERLRTAVRPGDVVSRWGGDEFVIVAEGLDLPQSEALADRAQLSVAHELDFDDGAWLVRVSTGAAARLPGEDPAVVVARADAAMYQRRRKVRAATGG